MRSRLSLLSVPRWAFEFSRICCYSINTWPQTYKRGIPITYSTYRHSLFIPKTYMKCKLTSSRCKCNDTNYYYHFFGLFNSQLKCMCPNFQLVKNLTKPIFRAQNTRICLQKCQPYREAKFTSVTHDLQRM